MSFSWPFVLFLLLLLPLLVGIYVWLLRRKRKFAVRYPSLSLIREALPRRSRWRRHLPFAVFLVSLASLIGAAARPQAVVSVPLSRATIILALDVSRSMCATDVDPNRLTVAQEVARGFVNDRAGDSRIGVVAFSGTAQLAVAPTSDKKLLIQAIDGFTTARGTAVGNALLKALDAIAEVNPDVTRSGVDLSNGAPLPSGAAGFEPDVIVLLTDGATTQGVNPIEAAAQAVDRRIRVYTISFGTSQPSPLVCSRQQLGSDVGGGQFGGRGGFGAGGAPVRGLLVDETTLQTVADMTGGSFHRAEDAQQLVEVFRDLPAEMMVQKEQREISAAFAAVGALLVTLAVTLSLAWNRYS